MDHGQGHPEPLSLHGSNHVHTQWTLMGRTTLVMSYWRCLKWNCSTYIRRISALLSFHSPQIHGVYFTIYHNHKPYTSEKALQYTIDLRKGITNSFSIPPKRLVTYSIPSYMVLQHCGMILPKFMGLWSYTYQILRKELHLPSPQRGFHFLNLVHRVRVM